MFKVFMKQRHLKSKAKHYHRHFITGHCSFSLLWQCPKERKLFPLMFSLSRVHLIRVKTCRWNIQTLSCPSFLSSSCHHRHQLEPPRQLVLIICATVVSVCYLQWPMATAPPPIDSNWGSRCQLFGHCLFGCVLSCAALFVSFVALCVMCCKENFTEFLGQATESAQCSVNNVVWSRITASAITVQPTHYQIISVGRAPRATSGN